MGRPMTSRGSRSTVLSSRSAKRGTPRMRSAVGCDMAVTLQPWRVPVIRTCRELLDPALGRLEQCGAPPVQRLPALPELDRLVDRHVATLELADDLLQLAAEVLDLPLGCVTVAHACTSSTVAARPPVASSISRRLPGASVAASFSAEPPERTMA